LSIDGELDECVRAILPELTELRHELHRYPQLGYEETFANERVCAALDEAGIAYESGLAATGVVGWLKPGPGGNAAEGAAVGLRADMDALAIEEQTELPYASEHPGRMHACGHDGHTAMLVGAAQVLGRLRDRLPKRA